MKHGSREILDEFTEKPDPQREPPHCRPSAHTVAANGHLVSAALTYFSASYSPVFTRKTLQQALSQEETRRARRRTFFKVPGSFSKPPIGRWGILFSHPRDFTPVCTTELGRAAKLAPEFAKRNVKLIALSIDSVEDHLAWSKDINAYNCDEPTEKLPFPIIDDKNRELAIQLGMLDPAEKDEKGMPVTARVVFVFGPDKKLKLSILYPATTGRNFDEILRVVASLQLTAEKRVATPVDWKMGDSVMVLPTIPEEEAKKLFPKGVFTKELPSGKKYLRYTPQP
ncbi:peroxiredoxin-6-like [Sorex fumeus]|uniref:peroxiredoxin-6-like n=1 Tax=Sorex fumeus TaxID=62283 RepID=UPI0024AE31C0|nr:peroxiredoxin-6-like [Sorex fumeus]